MLPEKECAGIAEEIQDAGILKANRQKRIHSSQDRRDDDPRLGNGQDRKKDTHAYDGKILKLPQPHGCLRLQVIRINSADGFAVKMKRTKAGAGLSNPVPRFRRRNGNGKNPDGQGFKSGDFFASLAKKYYSSLDRLDSRNGVKYSLVSVSECGIISTAQTDRQDES